MKQIISQNKKIFIIYILSCILKVIGEIGLAYAFKISFDYISQNNDFIFKEVALIFLFPLILKCITTYLENVSAEMCKRNIIYQYKNKIVTKNLEDNANKTSSDIINIQTNTMNKIEITT